MIFYILSCILLLLLINFHWKRRKLYSLSWSMNGGYALPIVGDAYKCICKTEDILENILNRVTNVYPSPIKFWFGPKFSVILTGVEHVEKVLTSSKFNQKGEVYLFLQEFDGEGLITSSETIMGAKVRAQEEGELDSFLKSINFLYVHAYERLAKFWLHNDFIYSLSGYKELGRKTYRPVVNFIFNALNSMKKIHEKEEYLDEETSDKSLLNRLLYIRDKYPDFATDKEIVDHISTFYSAAEDTSTIITCFSLIVFGMYPEIQDNIYDELRDVFGSTPRTVTMEDLSKLSYLKMCVKEILRLFPIAPFIIRTAREDFEIEKWVIPKDTMVILSIFNVHRDPSLWEKPNEFYPEHFLPEAVAKRNPYSFLAFSAGPRACIGKPYAYLSLYTILATLLQHYKFISEGKLQDRKLKADITIRFKDDDYSVRIVPRK